MEKTKKISWLAKLLFGKWCLMPGYSQHLDFYAETAKRSQIREDEFVDAEIERLAQEQFQYYVFEKAKLVAITSTSKEPLPKWMSEPIVLQMPYPHCYHVYDDLTAKYKSGRVNIQDKIQERYNELLSGHGHNYA